jgi:FkbM family methyltransferase
MIFQKIISFKQILISRGIKSLFIAIVNLLHLFIIRNILKNEFIKKTVNDYKMILLTNDRGISRSLILFGSREEDKKFILSSIINDNMNVFDIGSNIGYYSMFFLRKIKNGKLLAIEPSYENIELCKKNLKLNGININEVNFINGAASDKNGKKKFYLSKQSNLHSLNPEGSAKKFLSGEIRDINTFSIYNLSKTYFKPDLIRMDVEGHECEIISGMIKHIKSKLIRPHICFEPHISSYSNEANFNSILKKLFNLGYYTNLISSNAQTGTDRIIKYTGKKPFLIMKSDGEKRAIFKNLKSVETVKILTNLGGARTVLLSPR